jgi:hypothetical protein
MWEIRNTGLTSLDAVATDEEVMEIEREFDCWKIVLNTTEFLWAPWIRDDLATIERGPFALSIEGKTMVDRHRNKPLSPSLSIPVQRPWCVNLDSARGHFVSRVVGALNRLGRKSLWVPAPWYRRRFLHGAADGQYETGRHATALPVHTCNFDGLVLWLGYSPWTPEFRKRKLQIASTIPESSRVMSYGFQHLMSGWEMELLRVLLAVSSDRLDLSQGGAS